MKKRLRLIVAISLLFLFLSSGCTKTPDDETMIKTAMGNDYNSVVKEGLKEDGATTADILYEEEAGKGKVVYFTKHEALGLGYIRKLQEGWEYYRVAGFYSFQTDSKSPSAYMAGGTDVKLPDGSQHYLAMGRVFNPNIKEMVISDKKIKVIIKEKNGYVFWFKLLDNSSLFTEVKAYDKNGNEIK